jgi:endonuclease/exonuclease/phosphatase family metal-dependent hydrolase
MSPRPARLLAAALGLACVVVGAATPPPPTLRLITHNVWVGFTKAGEPRRTQWRAWMKEQAPDVVALQELNRYTAQTLAEDAAAWGHPHSVLLKEDGFPTGLTSRTPIQRVARLREGFHHGLLRAETAGLTLYVIHFHPSHFERRVEEARLLLADVAALPADAPPVVLLGDFNGFAPDDRAHYAGDPALEPFFAMLDQRDAPQARNLNQGQLDYQGLAVLLDAGYVDVIAHRRPPAAPFVGTFPSPLVAHENHGTDRRLDYFLIAPALLPRVRDAAILRDATTDRLSDHYPVRLDLAAP